MARITHLSLDSLQTPTYVSNFASHLSIRGALTQRESPLHPNWKPDYKYEAPGGSLSARAFRLPGLGTVPAAPAPGPTADAMKPGSSDLEAAGALERARSKGGAPSSCRCPTTNIRNPASNPHPRINPASPHSAMQPRLRTEPRPAPPRRPTAPPPAQGTGGRRRRPVRRAPAEHRHGGPAQRPPAAGGAGLAAAGERARRGAVELRRRRRLRTCAPLPPPHPPPAATDGLAAV